MENETYIRLFRKMLSWEWYTDVNTTKLYIHCLLKANFKDKEWRGVLIKRGTFLTSLSNLEVETGLSISQLRTSLNKLKKTNYLTSTPSSKNTVINVLNYSEYQNSDTRNDTQDSNLMTKKSQSDDKVVTTTNKGNNINKGNKKDITPKNKYLEFVLLTTEEYEKLIVKLGKETTGSFIERLNNYIGSKGKKYKSHYHTILNWYNKDDKQQPQKQTKPTKYYGEDIG